MTKPREEKRKPLHEMSWDEILFPKRDCDCGGTQTTVETSRRRGEYSVTVTRAWRCDSCGTTDEGP